MRTLLTVVLGSLCCLIAGVVISRAQIGTPVETPTESNMGMFVGPNGETITNNTNGSICFTGVGGANNESICLDLESVTNGVKYTTSTGVTDFFFNGINIYGTPTIYRGTQTSDTLPNTLVVHAGNAYSQATGANLLGGNGYYGSGLGVNSVTSITTANCVGRTVTAYLNGTLFTCTDGGNWTHGATDNEEATNLASCITTNFTGYTAVAVTNNVYLTPANNIWRADIAGTFITGPACGTKNEAQDGRVYVSPFFYLLWNNSADRSKVQFNNPDTGNRQAVYFGGVQSDGDFLSAATSYYAWSGRASFLSPSDAVVKVGNANQNAGIAIDAATADTFKCRNYANNADCTFTAGSGSFSSTIKNTSATGAGWHIHAAIAATCDATCGTGCLFGQITVTTLLSECATNITGNCFCAH